MILGLMILQIRAEILTFFNTDRISYKIIVLLPGQTLPEHWHPPMGDDPGKEEIMRVRLGEVYLYVSGEPTENIKAKVPRKVPNIIQCIIK